MGLNFLSRLQLENVLWIASSRDKMPETYYVAFNQTYPVVFRIASNHAEDVANHAPEPVIHKDEAE